MAWYRSPGYKRERRIRHAFRAGAANNCGLRVWRTIMAWFPQKKPARVAEELGIDHAVVSYGLKDGTLNWGTLIEILLKADKDLTDLRGPEKEKCAVGGYQEAVGSISRRRPSCAEVLLLQHLFARGWLLVEDPKRRDFLARMVATDGRLREILAVAAIPSAQAVDSLLTLDATFGQAFREVLDSVEIFLK